MEMVLVPNRVHGDGSVGATMHVISGGSKSSALLEYTWMHVILVETVDVGVPLYRVLKCEISLM